MKSNGGFVAGRVSFGDKSPASTFRNAVSCFEGAEEINIVLNLGFGSSGCEG